MSSVKDISSPQERGRIFPFSCRKRRRAPDGWLAVCAVRPGCLYRRERVLSRQCRQKVPAGTVTARHRAGDEFEPFRIGRTGPFHASTPVNFVDMDDIRTSNTQTRSDAEKSTVERADRRCDRGRRRQAGHGGHRFPCAGRRSRYFANLVGRSQERFPLRRPGPRMDGNHRMRGQQRAGMWSFVPSPVTSRQMYDVNVPPLRRTTRVRWTGPEHRARSHCYEDEPCLTVKPIL